ncbi:MAG TPA: DASS family sodium-coupled anion symporter [Fimbriimonadaceae bacterium]|nr:DASS family sodium-coupled anion symporter [Fimbriimonadaceae bacterium]
MSAAESRIAGKLAAAVAASLIMAWLLRDLKPDAQATGAVFTGTVILWLTQALPLAVSALLGVAALVVSGGSNEKAAFAAFGDPILLLFMGSFILAKGITESGLERRISHRILCEGWATRTPARMLLSIGAVSCGISLLVSNTAVTAMMLPIGIGLLAAIGERDPSSKFAMGMMLMLTWGSSVAVGVLVGTPPNLLAQAQIAEVSGKSIGFIDWMVFAMPINAVMLLAAWFVLRRMYARENRPFADATAASRQALAEMGPISQAERNTLWVFAVTFFLWLLPDGSGIVLGTKHPLAVWFNQHLTPSVSALIGAGLLFILPCRENPSGRTLSWKQASQIEWGIVLLIGGGMALGKAMFDSGLAEEAGRALATTLGVTDVWQITLLATFLAIAMSELASNTASATTVVPIAIGLAQAQGVSPVAPALGAAIGASFGFMLPVSTAPNALVYSSGLIPQKEMVKSGAIIDLIGLVTTVGLLRLILPMMGLD